MIKLFPNYSPLLEFVNKENKLGNMWSRDAPSRQPHSHVTTSLVPREGSFKSTKFIYMPVNKTKRLSKDKDSTTKFYFMTFLQLNCTIHIQVSFFYSLWSTSWIYLITEISVPIYLGNADETCLLKTWETPGNNTTSYA